MPRRPPTIDAQGDRVFFTYADKTIIRVSGGTKGFGSYIFRGGRLRPGFRKVKRK